MKIQIISDLHYEIEDDSMINTIPIVGDVVVIAGDYNYGSCSIDRMSQQFLDVPIVYVAGNHEHYTMNTNVPDMVAYIQSKAKTYPNIHFLENDSVIINNVRFIGSTLWTDFDLYNTQSISMSTALYGMNDFRHITGENGRLKPQQVADMFKKSKAYLTEEIAETSDDMKVVVITHYLPSVKSVDPKYAGHSLNPAFASNCDDLLEIGADLWIHGHTHSSCDYMVNNTRVVCNPAGYLGYKQVRENRKFNPSFVIEV